MRWKLEAMYRRKIMAIQMNTIISMLLFFVVGLSGCAQHALPEIPVSSDSVAAGTSVTRAGKAKDLIGSPITVGDKLPNIILVDRLMHPRALDDFRGKTVVLSIAPSLDTQVCERQTQLLGDVSEKELPQDIVRVALTRDLPFAHGRFAEQTGFFQITYLSDYKNADFGQQTGLLMDDLRLLARAVMVIDKTGTIRYMQVVPEVGHLPDMDKAFSVARKINSES
jgi:thiol peroxidase